MLVSAPPGAAQSAEGDAGATLTGNYLAGRNADRRNDLPNAVKYLGAALRDDPDAVALLARTFELTLMDGDMDEAIKILEEKNIPIAAGPRPRGDGASQLYIYDPDGHLIELAYIPWLD